MNASDPNIGEMLVTIGALSTADLSEARQIAKTLKQPLLKVLVQSAFLSQEEMITALEATQRLEPGQVDEQTARGAYQRARQSGITFAQALCELTSRASERVRQSHTNIQLKKQEQEATLAERKPCDISDLLLQSGVVAKEILVAAHSIAEEQHVPIENVLYGQGQITQASYRTMVSVRGLIERRTITVMVAAEILRKVSTRQISVERAMAELGLIRSESAERMRLGELLRSAGFISETDLQEAIKLSVWNDALIGKILVICGFISEQTLSNGLRCQYLMRQGTLKVEQAIIALHYCERSRSSIDDALTELRACA